MEASSVTENSTAGNDHDQEHVLNHGGTDSNLEINQEEEQVRRILQAISNTGIFWHDWNKLKSMLSFQLKLVLSEYPEAKMTIDEQNVSLGEMYLDLVTRLDEELHFFIEGPPFTLQRICEILLAARSIYPKLSKLALALEKNLLVTSTLTSCTKSYPETMPDPEPEPEKASEEAQPQSDLIQNEVEPMAGGRNEITTEVEADTEETAFQETVGPSEEISTAVDNS